MKFNQKASSEEIYEGLGIKKERAKELGDLIKAESVKLMTASDPMLGDLITSLAPNIKNIEEGFLVGFYLLGGLSNQKK